MLNKLILIIPILLFIILFFLFKYSDLLRKINNKFNNLPIIFLASLIIIFFVISLIIFSFLDGSDIESKYIPPYVEDGKLIKGKFENKK
ncbi:MAG: hypothetical protein CMM18_06035 [Rhodospirillaceae bacterium]|nr:hypothetical protein [Rhodospirillaceae bacterium]